MITNKKIKSLAITRLIFLPIEKIGNKKIPCDAGDLLFDLLRESGSGELSNLHQIFIGCREVVIVVKSE